MLVMVDFQRGRRRSCSLRPRQHHRICLWCAWSSKHTPFSLKKIFNEWVRLLPSDIKERQTLHPGSWLERYYLCVVNYSQRSRLHELSHKRWKRRRWVGELTGRGWTHLCHIRGVRSNRRRGRNSGGQLMSVEVGFSHWPRSPCFYVSIPYSIFDAWYWRCLGNSWHSGCCRAWPAFWLQVQLHFHMTWFL